MPFPPPTQRRFRRQLSIAFAIPLGVVAMLCVVFLGLIAYIETAASAALMTGVSARRCSIVSIMRVSFDRLSGSHATGDEHF